MKRGTFRSLAVFFALTAALSCTRFPPATPRVAISDGWLAMGTFFEADLRVPTGREAQARAWLDAAREEIARLERIYSRHDPESELSRWNESRGQATSENLLPVGRELDAILDHAIRLRDASAGAFDVGIGHALRIWTKADLTETQPSAAALRGALPFAPFETDRAQKVDLDGLSKGAVLDRLRELFVGALPKSAALLSFGQSSILAIGAPAEGSWRLRLQSNDPLRASPGEVLLRDQALSMSSTKGHLFEVDGVDHSHVIDPATGQPVEGTVESIVIADSAMIADAWSTALIVLRRIPALDSRDPYQDLEAQLIDATGTSQATSEWKRAAR